MFYWDNKFLSYPLKDLRGFCFTGWSEALALLTYDFRYVTAWKLEQGLGSYSLYCVVSPERLKTICVYSGQDGAIIITTVRFAKPSVYFFMNMFCEVSRVLEKAVAIEVRSGLPQQTLKDPYTSWTMLALGMQAKLVKAILHYLLHVILTSAS